MAKKKRRVYRPPRRPEASPAGGEEPPPTPPRHQPTRQELSAEEFKEEYAYVLKDLRRVFILATAMFLLLIALNLALR